MVGWKLHPPQHTTEPPTLGSHLHLAEVPPIHTCVFAHTCSPVHCTAPYRPVYPRRRGPGSHLHPDHTGPTFTPAAQYIVLPLLVHDATVLVQPCNNELHECVHTSPCLVISCVPAACKAHMGGGGGGSGNEPRQCIHPPPYTNCAPPVPPLVASPTSPQYQSRAAPPPPLVPPPQSSHTCRLPPRCPPPPSSPPSIPIPLTCRQSSPSPLPPTHETTLVLLTCRRNPVPF